VGPRGSVLGIDRDESITDKACRRVAGDGLSRTVRFEVGDIGEFRPAGTFDAVIGRYVLLYQQDPAAVLRHYSRFLRPGGLVIFHEVELASIAPSWPAYPAWDDTLGPLARAFDAAGALSDAGSRLQSLQPVLDRIGASYRRECGSPNRPAIICDRCCVDANDRDSQAPALATVSRVPTYNGEDEALLHYDVLGGDSTSPLIVLAGGAARHPDYLGDLAGLSGYRQLVVPHLRGVGRSAAADISGIGSWWRQACDIDRLRASLGLNRCKVVAHSAGTRLAIAYAAQFPGRLAGLALITPPASYLVDVPSDAPALRAARMTEMPFAAAVTAMDAGPDTSSDETFNAWQQAIAPLCYANWNEIAREHARVGRYALAAARAFLSSDPPPDLAGRLREVNAPVLVIAGAQDVIAGTGPVVAVADLFPDGRAAVIEHCGHMPWVEQPAAFREVLDPFLAGLDDRQPPAT
jgi:pimeloyl-ACP methyl ester carboxylesterase